MNRADPLNVEEVTSMIAAVDPDWRVRKTSTDEARLTSVARVEVEPPSGVREVIVKAHGGADSATSPIEITTEATLLSILGHRTALPVPTVLGLVDEAPDLPTPFFVMSVVPGAQVPKRDVGTISDGALERLARESGRALAQLHQLPAPDRFGRIVTEDVTGGTEDSALPTDVDALRVTGIGDESPSGDWRSVVADWVEQALAGLAESRFSDLTPRVRGVLEDDVDDLAGPFEPRIARIDHGLHNLTCDPATGELTGIYDWGFTLATPPAYDVACVLANFTLDPWTIHPDTPDREALVRSAFRDGYAAVGDATVLDQYDANRACYDRLCLTRAMGQLELAMLEGDEDDRNTAATALRGLVEDRF